MTLRTNHGRSNSDIETIKNRGLDGAEFAGLYEAVGTVQEILSAQVVTVELGNGDVAMYRDQDEADADAAEGNHAFAYLER